MIIPVNIFLQKCNGHASKVSMSMEDLKKYQLVLGLSFSSKMVVHIGAAQIGSDMDSNDLSNTFRSAYKAGHSTESALMCIQYDTLHMPLSKGMPTALVLFDLSVAFDTIDHATLLNCLSTRFHFTVMY